MYKVASRGSNMFVITCEDGQIHAQLRDRYSMPVFVKSLSGAH